MSLNEIFNANSELVIFIYGQVFFLMGMAVALQTRRYSRLELARSLSWLAAFGLVHGMYEWGDILIPIERQVLGEPLVRLLSMFYLALLGASFAFLFQFGASLLLAFSTGRAAVLLKAAPIVFSLTWAFVAFFVLPSRIPAFQEWQRTANALARYTIGLPGALLAAYGLRRHAQERMASLQAPYLVDAFRLAGISLGFYAFFGGFITPPVSFFPGNVFNSQIFLQFLGVPVIIFRSLTGLLLAVTVIRALEIFDLETARMIEAMEQKQILANERERIGRDLHDGAIQLVYTAGLLVDSARNQPPGSNTFKDRLDKAVRVLNEAITALRQNLMELRPLAGGQSLADELKALAEDARFASFVSVKLENELAPDDALSPMRQIHILAIVNEALTNVVRHANARRVVVHLSRKGTFLQIIVKDDGNGMPHNPQAGYGLRNMRDRARLIGGQLSIVSAGRHGTVITLDAPWEDET